MSNALFVNITGPLGIQSNSNNSVSVTPSSDSSTYISSRPNQIGTTYDAFGRMRISSPYCQFNNKTIYDAQPLSWDVATSGTATSTFNSSIPGVTITASSNPSTIIRRTKRRFLYQPGKSQIVYLSMTGAGNPVSGSIIWGYTDTLISNYPCTNGLYFSNGSTGPAVNIMTGGVLTTILQANWNGDKLNGTGSSGITLNFNDINLYFINFAWLGAGEVMFGCKVNNQLIVMHTYFNANVNTKAFILDCNLHLSYGANTNGGTSTSLSCVCATVITEGETDNCNVSYFAIDRGTTALNSLASFSMHPVLIMQINPNYPGSQIYLTGANILCSTGSNFRWGILLNPTITGALPTFVNQSSIQYINNTTNAITVTGGTLLFSGYNNQGSVPSSSNSNSTNEMFTGPPFLGLSASNIPDVLVLFIQVLNATVQSFYASITYQEII